jgi:hypothetical protein
MHTAESHAVDNRKFLKHQQRNAVAVAVKASPLSTPIEVRCHLKNSSPQKQINVQLLSSVRRTVHTKRTNMTSISFPLCPVQVTGSLGSLTSLCKSMFLPDLIRRHNDHADDFRLDFHTMVCIAFKTDGGTFVLLLLYVTLMYVTSDHVCCHRGQTTVHGLCKSVHARRTGSPISLYL